MVGEPLFVPDFEASLVYRGSSKVPRAHMEKPSLENEEEEGEIGGGRRRGGRRRRRRRGRRRWRKRRKKRRERKPWLHCLDWLWLKANHRMKS